jgi:hypothetical protein
MKKSPWRSLRVGQLRKITGGGTALCLCSYDPRAGRLVINPNCPIHGYLAQPGW